MKETKLKRAFTYMNRHYRWFIIGFCLGFIAISYFILMSLTNNHLSYTHVLYFPIVVSGIVLGPLYGMFMGILSGLVVGPIMPRFLDTNTPQYLWDWVFRLVMFAVIGALVGYISKNYSEIIKKVNLSEMYHPESGILNINYLRKINLEHKKTYTVSSYVIYNHETIRDVIGHETYYDYLSYMKDQIQTYFSDAHVVQSTNHSLWILFEQTDLNVEMANLVQLAQTEYLIDHKPIYVDFAFGFHTVKHMSEKRIADYFIEPDLAADEAKRNFLTHSIYSDVRTQKQFEYEILSDFNQALHSDDIYLVYQPKIDLKTRKPSGLEALIRWEHPTKKMIAPDQFIPAIEKTAMIHEMTQLVFDWALSYQMRLLALDIRIPISINISTKNLYDHKFFDKMVKIFSKYNVLPSMVEFELTETVLMEDPELSKYTLDKFSSFGFRIAIDDFGKGYSSLAYLAQFPINTIKIDKFFARQILINPTSQAIVKATIDLARQLGYEVLIEGIEDIETANLLEKLGCQSAQGYYFMRPRREDDITDYLKKNKISQK
jgi:EAL domain-containing protein (putative c-di-GMP-specific phosphodiesterase class I)